MKLPSLKSKSAAPVPGVAMPVNETAPQAHGLIKLFIPAIVAALLFTLAVLGVAYVSVIVPQQENSSSSMAKIHANAYVNYLNQQLRLAQESLRGFTSEPSIAALTDPALANDREKREKLLASSIPYARAVHIYGIGQAQANMEATVPVGYAALDLVTRAEKGEPTPVEVHKTQQGQFLNIAMPIKREGVIVGTLLGQLQFASVVKNIPDMPPEIGYLTWTQYSAGVPPVVLMTRGDERWKQTTPISMDSINPTWKIAFYPAADLSGTSSNTSLILVGGFQLMLLLGLLLLIFIRLRTVLLADAANFNNFSKQLLLNSNQNIPNYAFDLFRFLSAQLINYAEKIPRGRGGDVRAPEGKRDDVSINPIFQNKEVLDVDINDDDNLFGASVSTTPAPVASSRPPVATVEPMEFSVGPKLPAEIFRAYDIRGTFGQTLTEDYAFSIGQAVGSEVLSRGENTLVVARDGRTSSPVLQQAVINGLIASGCDVLDIGEVPTPVLYFATHELNAQSGVMVTGSHNPPDHNGFKIVISGETLSGDQIQNLRRRIEKNQFSKGDGYQQKIDILPEYIEKITSSVVLARPLKVVLDCGNGVGGKLAPHILTEMGCKVVELFCEVDGRFPNHQPDPSQPENLKALQAAVIANEADIGIALDGDADRIGVVTNRGTIIWPDRLLMLYARDLLARNPGSDVVFDVKCSRDLADLISASGGRPIMWKSGHSLMKAKMRETGALLGGELSGHIFFADQWYGFDDGIYAAARLLEILSMEPIDAEEIFAEFPAKVSTPEFLIKLPETAKFAMMQRLENGLQFKDGKIITIDGIRVDFPYGWGLVRVSNTTAALTARFEADNEESLKDIERRFREQLLGVDPSLQLPF